MYIWIYANSLYNSSPIQTGHYDIVLTYCNNVSLQKCTFYTITSHHKHMLILCFIIYISNQFKTKCITIWTSYGHKHPCHSTAKGLFSRDVRCRKRPRSESPAKGEAEKAMKRKLENNKNWMKFWIKSISSSTRFYPILPRHVAAVGVFDQSMELFTSRLQYDVPKCWLWNRGLWCSKVCGVIHAMKHYL